MLLVFIEELYMLLPNPIQLVALKVLLISVGVLHAHIIGKLFIDLKVDWEKSIVIQSGGFYARVSLYIIIPICYALGG
jgi:hypothetical protein